MTNAPQVILLNGGSSSGKTSLARALQTALDGWWLRLGVDDLITACPPGLLGAEGLDIGADGSVGVGAAFTAVERCWMAGIAAMVRAGARVVVEDGFVSGPAAQQRWREALTGIDVVWVGVHLAPHLAREREKARGDRAIGMAEAQALAVHEGIDYDLTVDTSTGDPATLARDLVARIAAR